MLYWFDGKSWVPSSLNLISDKYVPLEKIGEGSFGQVFKAQDKTTGKIVAIKEMISENMELIEGEIAVLMTLSCHPSVICIEKAYRDDNFVYIITDYIPGPTLTDIINMTNEQMPSYQLEDLMKQLVSAVKYIHNEGIAHKDIKPGNIILDNGKYKLIDFGLSCSKDVKCVVSAGTDIFVPPEVYTQYELLSDDVEYAKKEDIWALGVTFFIAANKQSPVDNNTDLRQFYDTANVYASEYHDLRLNDIINWILTYNYKLRPNIDQIFESLYE